MKWPYEKHGLYDSLCAQCVYRERLDSTTMMCGYIGIKEKMRPCPAGKGCTEFIKGSSLAKRKDIKIITQNAVCKKCGRKIASNRQYCDECRKIRQEETNRQYQQKRTEERRRAAANRKHQCAWCGKIFLSPQGNVKYCPECRKYKSHAHGKKVTE